MTTDIKINVDDIIEINGKAQRAYDALMAVDSAIYCALGTDHRHPLVVRLNEINDELCEVFDAVGATYIKH